MDDATRRDVADVVDSVPCWMAIALLTLADVVLFAWQLLPGTNAAEAQWLRGLELAINALFVCELGLRFVAAGGDFLRSWPNVLDTVVIVCAFVLCLAELTSAPVVALRGLRIARYALRGVRGACAASRIDATLEMRGLMGQKDRGSTLMGRVAHRAREADVAPLHVDVSSGVAALSKAVTAAREPRAKHRASAVASDSSRLLACISTLPRRARELMEQSEAEAATYRAAYRAARSAALDKTPPPPSPVGSLAAAPARKESKATDLLLASAPRVNPLHAPADVEAPAPSSPVVLKLREPPAATASAPALLGLFEHALDDAKARNAPPPRLAALLRGSPGLVFLKGDL